METFHSDFITVINSALLIMDYQEGIIRSVGSGSRNEITSSAVAVARAADILNVPVIISSIDTEENGIFIREISDIFPTLDIYERPSSYLDAFRDERVLKAARKMGREKLVITGLLTSTNFIQTALHGIKEGYDVFCLIDACGDVSTEAYNLGLQKMLRAGVTPITWMSLASEWMNVWIDPVTGDLTDEVFGKYNAMLSYISRR